MQEGSVTTTSQVSQNAATLSSVQCVVHCYVRVARSTCGPWGSLLSACWWLDIQVRLFNAASIFIIFLPKKKSACKYCCVYRCFSSVQRTCAHNNGCKQRLPGLAERIDDMSRRRNNKNKTPDDTFTVLTFPVWCLDLTHVRWPSCDSNELLFINCQFSFTKTVFTLAAQGM